MNTKSRKLMKVAAFLLTFCMLPLGQWVLAQSANNCQKVQGKFTDFGGLTTTTTITNGGILNSTGQTIYADFGFPTPDPTTFSFTGDSTLPTNRGVLKTHNIYIADISSLAGTALFRIDPSTSTGIFAGATGTLFVDAKFSDAETAAGEITGEICFAP